MRDSGRIYGYGRNTEYLNRYSSRKSRSGRGWMQFDGKMLQGMIDQFIVSCVIALLIIIMSNFNVPFINNAMKSIKWAAGENYDFKGEITKIKDTYIPNVSSKLKEAYKAVENFFGKTTEGDIPTINAAFMVVPVDGETILPFGTTDDPVSHEAVQHNGMDIAGSEGTPIKAALGGTVEKVDVDNTLGKYVMIKHNGGIETIYAHCSEILVKVGQEVNQEDIIAKVGSTGDAKTAHLHFEVMQDGKLVDPEKIIGSIIESK